jgi:hypothetical protein
MKEKTVHSQVVHYIKRIYPDVIFRTDFAAGARMPLWQAIQHKAMQGGRGFPDLFIAEARRGFHGLFVEIKNDGVVVYKKDGSLRKNDHLAEQNEVLTILTDKGYKACFAVGFDGVREVIDWYLSAQS